MILATVCMLPSNKTAQRLTLGKKKPRSQRTGESGKRRFIFAASYASGKFVGEARPLQRSRRSKDRGPNRLLGVNPTAIFRVMSDVTRILAAIEEGDAHAAEQLLPLVYDELRKLAAQKLAQE